MNAPAQPVLAAVGSGADIDIKLIDVLKMLENIDGEISTTWGFYFTALSATFVALTLKSWRPNPYLLGGLFFAFSLSNLNRLLGLISDKAAYLNFAEKLSEPSNASSQTEMVKTLLMDLRSGELFPSASGHMPLVSFHVLASLLVVAIVVLVAKSATDGGARPSDQT